MTAAEGVVAKRETLERALMEHLGELLLLVDLDGRLMLRLGAAPLGYGDQREGRHILDLVHPDDLPRGLELLERARRTHGFEETIRLRARHRDGTWRDLEVTVWDRRDDLGGAVVRVRDGTSLDRPPEGDDRFASLADALPSGVLAADSYSMVVFANDNAGALFDVPVDSLYQQGWQDCIVPEDLPEVTQALRAVLTHAPRSEVTFRIRTAPDERWMHATFVPVSTGGRQTGWLGMLNDVTARREAESRLAHVATHDALTGLPNRLLLEDRLDQALARVRRTRQPLVVLFVDLDDFKVVNDRCGHAAGDLFLQEIAHRLTHVVRPSDTVVRLGGDEFVVVCEGLDGTDGQLLAERIREAVRVPLLMEQTTVAVDASVGVAHTFEPDEDSAALLARADQAMYRDKRSRDAAHEATS